MCIRDSLSTTGMDKGAVMTATIVSAGLTTILMGLLTNYPFALASGMGLNAFFAFVVASQYGWQAALGAVFISGVIFTILAAVSYTHLDVYKRQILRRYGHARDHGRRPDLWRIRLCQGLPGGEVDA